MEWNNALMSSFTITQLELGAQLIWEPAVGTPEHENLIDTYIAGPGTLQQKRATIALDFFDMVAASALPAPFSRIYHVSMNAYLDYSWDWSPLESTISSASSWSSAQPSSSSTPSSSSGSLKSGRSLESSKRRRVDTSPSTPAKRLPGFSIMTKDGVDITENHCRGPKSKEQREQAAKMRKLGACPRCKRSKQKCEPSHHRPLVSAQSEPMSATLSSSGSWAYETPSLDGSRISISPQTSFDDRFSPAIDNQPLVNRSGRSFSPTSVARDHALSSWDFFADTPSVGSSASISPPAGFNHHSFASAQPEAMPATLSSGGAWAHETPSLGRSRVTASPQTSFDDRFSPATDNQPLVVRHSGRSYSPLAVTPNSSASPADISRANTTAPAQSAPTASASPARISRVDTIAPAQSAPMSAAAVSSGVLPVATPAKTKQSSQAGIPAQSAPTSAAAVSSGVLPVAVPAKTKQSSQAGIPAQSAPTSAAAVSSGVLPVAVPAKTRQSSQDSIAGGVQPQRHSASSPAGGRLSAARSAARKISQGLGVDQFMDRFMGAFSRLGIA